MSEELDALWARLLDEGKVRWVPGMSVLELNEHELVEAVRDGVPHWRWDDGVLEPYEDSPSPAWTDPGTLGCLTAMAREAWGRPDLTTVAAREADGSLSWEVECIDGDFPLPTEHCPTEAEALLRAIDAAPGRS